MAERIADDVLSLIGRTPLVRVRRLSPPSGAEIVAKLERVNPGGSVKDRIALEMIRAAEAEGRLSPGATIVEPTSGNTGIGLALVCAVRGYRCVVVMPDDMSIERRRTLAALGAEVVLTSALDGMGGAVEEARRIAEQRGALSLSQFQNPANPAAHARTTGPEIWEDTGGKVDALVCGVGTGGTLSGAGRYLRTKNPAIRLVAVEPGGSAVLSGGVAGLHALQGIGAGFVPATLDRSLIDRIIKVEDEQGLSMMKRAAREEGLFVGPSSGAALFAAVQVAAELSKSQRVLAVLPDGGDRYVL
ncbi:MAG: cysteine synthase A [Myxococcales bacterium]|nr:cysteine synthase A [Myxococcales bacterium]